MMKQKTREKMNNFQVEYTVVISISFVLGIAFFFIDGMLLWSILSISLFIILILFRMIWNIAGWADRVTRKLGED